VPLSLLGTFDIMALLGYSLDTLSLMALTISTGFVIDDAIVVVENVSRHLERGASPREAARAGSQEIAFTVLSMSTSLVAVFIPILLMQGIVGRIFREFAVTLAAAIGVSMVVSLTTTPMLCAQVLRRDDGRRHGWLYRLSERAFDRSLDIYDALLGPVLRHPAIMLVVVAITMAVTFHLYTVVPKGFFPQEDTGTLTGNVQARQDISFQAMHDKLTRIANIVTHDPAVESVVAFTGGGGSTTNTARLFITLKPLADRGATPNEIIGRLVRRTAMEVEGARLFLQMAQDIRVGGRSGNAQYQYTLQADNVGDLTTWAPRVTSALTGLPELSQVNSDQQNRSLQSSIDVNRDAATRLGLTMRTIDASLGSAFGQSEVSTIYTPLNQYHVVMEAAPVWWQSPDTLQRFYVRSAANAEVPLASFSSYRSSLGTLAVTHHGQVPSATISFNLAPGKSLGEAVDAVNEAMRSIGLPPSMRASFQGTAQAFQSSLQNQLLLVLAAIAVVYIVLGVLYESMVHPITILSTLPSAGMGALLALMWFRLDLSVMAIIGILLLVGIVKKNAIMMIDVALETSRRGGTSPEEAIRSACLVRFRPIMMTTMAAMLGALPVALASGIGSELRQPLGVAIVGGLLVSQILTLFTTPIIYLTLERLREATIRRV
jgi:multidrug efflux pump